MQNKRSYLHIPKKAWQHNQFTERNLINYLINHWNIRSSVVTYHATISLTKKVCGWQPFFLLIFKRDKVWNAEQRFPSLICSSSLFVQCSDIFYNLNYYLWNHLSHFILFWTQLLLPNLENHQFHLNLFLMKSVHSYC